VFGSSPLTPVPVAVANQGTSGASVVLVWKLDVEINVSVDVCIVVVDIASGDWVVGFDFLSCSFAASGMKVPVKIQTQITGMTTRAIRPNMLKNIPTLRWQRLERVVCGFSVTAMVVVIGSFLSPAAILLTKSTVSTVAELPKEERRISKCEVLISRSTLSIWSLSGS
jgi:hypothetical protein